MKWRKENKADEILKDPEMLKMRKSLPGVFSAVGRNDRPGKAKKNNNFYKYTLLNPYARTIINY